MGLCAALRLVPEVPITGLGSAIFALIAAGIFSTVEDAQKALSPSYKVFEPQESAAVTYAELYALFKRLYFGMGRSSIPAIAIGDVLPCLRRIAGS